MDIKSCRGCGKLFQYRGGSGGKCPDCVREMDELFTSVRDYMYHNPRANIDSICVETGATVDMIQEWLREGRLIASEGSAVVISCSSCGAPILTGQYCAKCSNNFVSQMSGASNAMRDELRRKEEAAARRGLSFDVGKTK
ncbi:MAG: flagellar protein [Oscillospiraceae bacterium]|nr:flagellar protein [Oscillospiraceae bacterium]